MTNADNNSHQLSVQEFLIAIRDETSIEAELIDLKNAGEQSEGDRALAVELRSALREIASLKVCGRYCEERERIQAIFQKNAAERFPMVARIRELGSPPLNRLA